MKITYDPKVDALYIRFPEATVTTKHFSDGLAADFDALGHLAGIEMLGVTEKLRPSALKQVTSETTGLTQPKNKSNADSPLF